MFYSHTLTTENVLLAFFGAIKCLLFIRCDELKYLIDTSPAHNPHRRILKGKVPTETRVEIVNRAHLPSGHDFFPRHRKFCFQQISHARTSFPTSFCLFIDESQLFDMTLKLVSVRAKKHGLRRA
jgi:hypothetical protein